MIALGKKPEISFGYITDVIERFKIHDPLVVIGVRGFFKDSMGVVGRNDRGIYDDAIFVVSNNCFVSFNANTDPSRFQKGMALLHTGLWKYKIGIHGLSKPKAQQYKALVQASDVTVIRDDVGSDTGRFGINIHKGGFNTTGSMGCQTVYPTQWDLFINLIEQKCNEHKLASFPYLLLNNENNEHNG